MVTDALSLSLARDYLSHDGHRASINESCTAQDIKRMLDRYNE